MIVRQLIVHLQALNMPNARVVTPGFDESDLEDVDTVKLLWVVFHDDSGIMHGGRHEEYPQGSEGHPEQAVFLNF